MHGINLGYIFLYILGNYALKVNENTKPRKKKNNN